MIKDDLSGTILTDMIMRMSMTMMSVVFAIGRSVRRIMMTVGRLISPDAEKRMFIDRKGIGELKVALAESDVDDEESTACQDLHVSGVQDLVARENDRERVDAGHEKRVVLA